MPPDRSQPLPSSPAQPSLDAILRWALIGTGLTHAYVGMFRLKLRRIGAMILHNTHWARLLLPSRHPWQKPFFPVAARLQPT